MKTPGCHPISAKAASIFKIFDVRHEVKLNISLRMFTLIFYPRFVSRFFKCQKKIDNIFRNSFSSIFRNWVTLRYILLLVHNILWYYYLRGGSRGGRTRRAPPLKLKKIWFFGVNKWDYIVQYQVKNILVADLIYI